MTDPLVRLARIQGPARHAWWSFWMSVHARLFRSALRGSGPWSPAWVVAHVAFFLARLERFTR